MGWVHRTSSRRQDEKRKVGKIATVARAAAAISMKTFLHNLQVAKVEIDIFFLLVFYNKCHLP